MEKYFIESFSIALIYLIFKIFEKRFILKEEMALKDIVKDTIVIYLCGIVGLFIFGQIQEEGLVSKETVNAFVDNPSF